VSIKYDHGRLIAVQTRRFVQQQLTLKEIFNERFV